MSEEEFLKSTPKKLFKLAAIHQEVNTPKDGDSNGVNEPKEVYIDSLNL